MKRDCLYVFFCDGVNGRPCPVHVQFSCHIEPWCPKPSVCPGRAGSRTCLRFVLATFVFAFLQRARLAVPLHQPQTRSEFFTHDACRCWTMQCEVFTNTPRVSTVFVLWDRVWKCLQGAKLSEARQDLAMSRTESFHRLQYVT